MAAENTGLSLRATVALCAFSGCVAALCFPPAGLWPMAWVALVPWLVAVRLGRAWSALLGSWLAGFVFFGGLLYWLYLFGLSVWALACGVLALAGLIWGASVRWTGSLNPTARVVGAAVLWSAVEWARGLGQYGFTWGWLGYSQSPAPSMLPVARLAGTVGLSFLIALVNAALAEAVVGAIRRDRVAAHVVRAAATVALAAAAVLGAGRWATRQASLQGPEARVAIIQGSAHGPLRAEEVNVPLTPEDEARTREIYSSLTAEAARENPALVVWPESVLPASPEDDPTVAAWLSEAARTANAWLLAGGPHYEDRRIYNSAYLLAPTGNRVSRYDKVQLVPFGEYVPGRESLPLLDRYHVRERDFSSGTGHRVLQAGTIALGPMICFESVFPQIAWDLVGQGADILLIITNDAWFGRTAAAAQHRQIAVLRAVETNRWVVRGASTGISCLIAPDGRIVAEAGLFEQAVVSGDVRLPAQDQRPGGWGPLVPWLMLYGAVAFLIAPAAVARGGGNPAGRRDPPVSRPRSRRRRPGRRAAR